MIGVRSNPRPIKFSFSLSTKATQPETGNWSGEFKKVVVCKKRTRALDTFVVDAILIDLSVKNIYQVLM